MVALQVEGTRYRVHSYFFEQYSEDFAVKYKLSEKCAFETIHLDDVKTRDFEQLLSIFYPRSGYPNSVSPVAGLKGVMTVLWRHPTQTRSRWTTGLQSFDLQPSGSFRLCESLQWNAFPASPPRSTGSSSLIRSICPNGFHPLTHNLFNGRHPSRLRRADSLASLDTSG